MPLAPLYLATAVEAALSAGRVHRRYFRQPVQIERKGPIDLVTTADIEAEREIRRIVSSRFPSDAVLGEESGGSTEHTGPNARWIVDPLDGTTNFAHGLALFCVSIAVEVAGEVVLGVVYDPIGEELFTAERDMGARLNGVPIHVSPHATLIDTLVVTGFPYSVFHERQRQVAVFGSFLGRTRGVRRLGSAALDLCYVAAGRMDAFWEEQLHAWDIAAGQLIVQEAGGRVTDYSDLPLDLFVGEILATNGHVHSAVRRVILDPAASPER